MGLIGYGDRKKKSFIYCSFSSFLLIDYILARNINRSHLIPDFPADRDVPIVYKKAIVFFRSLYSLVRLLPCYRLSRIIGRQARSSVGEVIYRISTSRVSSPDEAGLTELHINGDMVRGISEFTFEPLQTPLGVVNLHVAYRLDCGFSIENSDAVLSHRFINNLENNYHDAKKHAQRRRSSGSINSRSNSIKGPSTSSEYDQSKAVNNGVDLPPSIPVTGNQTRQFEASSSPDSYRFRVESLPGPRKEIGLLSHTQMEHFTPPSFPSSSMPKRFLEKSNENPMPFLLRSSQRQYSSTQAQMEDIPIGNILESPPFALPLNVQSL